MKDAGGEPNFQAGTPSGRQQFQSHHDMQISLKMAIQLSTG